MSYTNGAAVLQFPSHYTPLTEEEMEYIVGGRTINMEKRYLNKDTCMEVAYYYRSVTGLSQTTIAHELYAHAVAYYMGAKLCGKVSKNVADEIRLHAKVVNLGGGSGYGEKDPLQSVYDLIWKLF